MASNLKVIFLFLWLLQCGEVHSPTDNTCLCTAPSLVQRCRDAQAEIRNSEVSGDVQLAFDLENRFLFIRGGNVDVQQKPPIQVALLKEGISIPCKVIFPYMPRYTRFSIFYYWINSLGQKTSIYSRSEKVEIPSGKENTTAVIPYDHRIMPLENTSSTGTYYCEVKWNDIQKMGKGVFVLARGTGYIQTSYGWQILITVTTLLVALSITATALLLWKRKVLCPVRNQLNIRRQKVETQPPSASPPPPSPVYDRHSQMLLYHLVLFKPPSCWPSSRKMCLDSQQVDVYSTLKNNTNNQSLKNSPPGKTPKKQATLEESSDTLYENI